jgi:hypothetical protein
VNCPHCRRDFVPVEGQRFCSWCGAPLETPSGVHYGEPAEQGPTREHPPSLPSEGISPRKAEYCPWEDQENLGFVQGIYQTIRQSLFSPKDFFAGLPRHGGLLNPLFYALIVGTVGSMVGYLWSFAFGNSLMSTMSLSKGGAVALAFLIPILIFMGLVVAAVLLHVSLFLIGGANEDFEATFRVVCYSAAPDLFGVLPIIGGFIGLIWKIYITVVGVREVHGISTAKSVLAFVLPTLVCCGLVLGGMVLVFMVAGSSFTKT